jgi:hypothetical protein
MEENEYLKVFGIMTIRDALQASPFHKHFDGEVLMVEVYSDDPDNGWMIVYNGYDVVGSAGALRLTQSKFDAWMNRLDGKVVQVSEALLDRWVETIDGVFGFTGDELRRNVRFELERTLRPL